MSSPVVDSALRAAAGLTGMEVVFLSGMTPSEFTFVRVLGTSWPGLGEGVSMPRADSFCARMLDGAPPSTASASTDPAYGDSRSRTNLQIESYVGVPVLTSVGVVGTL